MDLLIATTNGHKIRELRALLKPFGNKFDVYSLLDFSDYVPPEETGTTFCENAKIKAEKGAKTLKKWTIADDSGLVVPALNGAPGVYSARYAGEKASDQDNRKKLLKEMAHLEEERRFAYFECCVVLASPQGAEKTVTGTCDGMIQTELRGGNGFGYDPLFVKEGYRQTFAELEESVKNKISHRGKAFQKLLMTLETLTP